jgi:hypothetical protein
MFRAFTCPSSGVQVITYCICNSAQVVVVVIPEEPGCSSVKKNASPLLGITNTVSYNLYS